MDTHTLVKGVISWTNNYVFYFIHPCITNYLFNEMN